MAKALKCDRCGGFYDLLKNLRNYRIVNVKQGVSFEHQVDLCPECYGQLINFLKGTWHGVVVASYEFKGDSDESSDA